MTDSRPNAPQPELMKELDDFREAVDRLRNAVRPEHDRRQLADRRSKPRATAHDRRRGTAAP